MKLYLFNLTDKTFFVKSKPERSENAIELSVIPNDFAELPVGKDKFGLSSARANPEITSEKVLLGPEVERQYLVNPKECSSFGWSHVSMPEDCPWRIYRDQVTSLILLRLSVKFQ